ncbi:MAG: LytR C-terminal domain-containing protein [Candidatus Levybacteria bacterium]|nr:LytR C-terminal domain-containing protein [Candidatus Levybacteria bacterium]
MAKSVKTVLYLTDKNLFVQTEKSVIKSITFPPELLEENHVSDLEAFTAFLIKELTPLVKKISPAVVVLGSGILFQSFVTKKEEVTLAQDALKSTLPFPKEFASEKTISTPTKTYLLATHRLYLQALTQGCEEIGIELRAVLPLTLFSDEDYANELNESEVKTILTEKKLYAIGDFLEVVPVAPTEDVPTKESGNAPDDALPAESNTKGSYGKITAWNVSRLLVVLGFLIVLTSLMGGLLYIQYRHLSSVPKVTEDSALPTSTPVPTKVEEVKKSELTVIVMNGTGTAGQAGRVRDLLSAIDYENISTENADSNEYEKTEIVFSSKVSMDQQNEIKELLLKTFSTVTSKVDSTATNDIQVITGEEK